MKIPAIKAICKAQKKTIVLMDGPDRSQWIGVPGAMYAVDRGIELNKQNIAGVFDLSEAEANSFRIMHEETADVRFQQRRMQSDVEPCERFPLSINLMGSTLMPIKTDDGMMMVSTELLKAADRKHAGLEFFVREAPGLPLLLAVFSDMFTITALIAPIAKELTMDAMCRISTTFRNARARETGEQRQGETLQGEQQFFPGMHLVEDEKEAEVAEGE